MAAMLKGTAVANVNKGHPSSYYAIGRDGKPNPVIQALEQEIKKYAAYMKKRATPGYVKPTEEASSRPADTLFELWNKYEPKLDKIYYQAKLLEMGDFLVSIKEYKLALFQCYGRYLKSFGDVNVEEITAVEEFKMAFFPDGFGTEDAGFTFRALMGKSICTYQVIRMEDPKLQNSESVNNCVQLLNFLRLMTQVILPTENLCWLVYNGTIHIYSISRHLMALGHSAKVLEYLLWASMSMESSVPLLGVRYLTWRATLYTAVCQCYFDCKSEENAEAFARRALTKINELSQLESLSNEPESKETEEVFRHATVKMAIMVFKRTAFETRRKPKGLLRPKTRANLSDAARLPWPRTASEKLLADMFEGSSAQMLCLLETLTDSNRRTLISAPPAAETEVEILDVYAELFLSAIELIAGGGGTSGNSTALKGVDIQIPGMGGVVKERSLMEMSSKGEDGVPLSAAVKIVKHAYNYEQWDTFDSLLENTMNALREVNDQKYGPDEKALEILHAYDKVVPRNKQRRLFGPGDDELETPILPPPTSNSQAGKSTSSLQDDLIHLAEVLLSVVNGPFTQTDIDMDMMVDACLMLWKKCKEVFAKYQTGSTDNPKYLQKMENPSKWVYILDIIHQTLGWCGLSAVDPSLTAEVVLRLALVFEASAALDASNDKKSKSGRLSRMRDDDDQSVVSSSKDISVARRNSNVTSASSFTRTNPDIHTSRESKQSIMTTEMLTQNVKEQLLQAREILDLGLQNVSYARQVVALTDGKSIADISWVKELNEDLFSALGKAELESLANESPVVPDYESDATSVWSMVKDLHLELIFMYHRVCLKLSQFHQEPTPKPHRRGVTVNDTNTSEVYIETFDELVEQCKRNNLSKSLLYMQKALILGSNKSPTTEQRKLLEESVNLIKKAETEEKKLYIENTVDEVPYALVPATKVPGAPVLLSRTDTTATFRPPQFKPETKEKVAWYRIFAKSAAGSNVKVRLNDYNLPGTGEQVPSFRCILTVGGLTPGERYMYAVAAYTQDGKLIGGTIGDTTKPILASHPLPILMNWAYLAQVSYQIGCFPIARDACGVLWDHFVALPPPPESITFNTSNRRDFKLTLHRLNRRVVALASPVLLRMFLSSIFIDVDMNVKDGALFCDQLCDKGPLNKAQTKRLEQCEKMLVALELAGWLNESGLALQAVVQCYGLISPFLYFNIPAIPVIQVMERCMAVLQEIPSNLRQKRTTIINESLHHMTACLTYQMAKVLRTWGQRALASNINEAGRKMLSLDPEKDAAKAEEMNILLEAFTDYVFGKDTTETGALTLGALKKKKTKKAPVHSGKEDSVVVGNEELKALEAHMLRLSKQGAEYKNQPSQGEHELTGSEDPSILHAYIAYLPSKMAYKEVSKFRRRARFLEFLVQVAQKALQEGLPEDALIWCEETAQWLFRRNEQILGVRANIGKQPGAMTIIGDDPKKYAAAVAEYGKAFKSMSESTVSTAYTEFTGMEASPRAKVEKNKPPPKPKKRAKYKAIGITPNMNDAQKSAQEELELKALELLNLYFVDMFLTQQKRKRLRKIAVDEMPWRVQLNIVQGLSEFGVFVHRLETREKLMGGSSNYMYKATFLDQEWFTFETAGTLVVGWSGGPARQHTREPTFKQAGDAAAAQTKASGIEIAAAAATGKAPPPQFPMPPEEDDDTPRTYRSEGDPPAPPKKSRAGKKKEEKEDGILSKHEAIKMLQKTFMFFKRAVVLAHRGQHWTLLQNACRAVWNCAHTCLMRAISPDKFGEPFMDTDTLRSIVWETFWTSADCLLDMLVKLQYQKDILGKQTQTESKKRDIEPEDKMLVRSWMGTVTSEKGGASLKFEAPLDDIGTVDMRWLKRIVERVVEMLYYEHRWERLVDIALRFNAVSDNRYSEQVNPLLVQAQRKLISRIANNEGRPPPQPHFVWAEQQTGGPITPQVYANLQLKTQLKGDDMSDIHPGAGIDPEGHDAYSGGVHALRMVSVPLDVVSSLQDLRSALDVSSYTSRALQHSRRLLVLYLAGHTAVQEDDGSIPPSRAQSRVEFKPNTARPQPTMPVDISKEEFLSMDDVQTSPIPRSQVGVVMQSYDKSIEMLLASNQKGLAAEAMRELGNLHYHSNNIRGAYKWWAESLDTLLGTMDAIHNWRTQFQGVGDISQALLNKCGLWGCILGGVLASNIAQYVLTSNLGLRSECCFLSGYFFKALFRSSLPHPTADRDYAMYEVGEGCEVTNLVPGIDLLSERFRCDGRTLVAALRCVMDELARGRHNLFVLPLMTLYQYFTTFVCRDLQRSVDGRILKIVILTDLGLFNEAFITLQRLLHGERLPHTADQHFRQTESKIGSARFNTAKPIQEPCNLRVLESVIDKRLSSNLGAMYGPHLTCYLSVAQAHLLNAVAATIPVLPQFEEGAAPGSSVVVEPQNINTNTKNAAKSLKIPKVIPEPPPPDVKKKESVRAVMKEMQAAMSDDTSSADGMTEAESTVTKPGARFTGKAVTLEEVKGTLLSTSDQILSTVSEIIVENALFDKGLENMTPSELELVVITKLELAEVARQRQHAIMATRIIHSAMRIVQKSNLFVDKPEEVTSHGRMSSLRRSNRAPEMPPIRIVKVEDSQYQYQNFQSRSRLDARLWLMCRLAMVRNMMGEIRGLGQVKGPERQVKSELLDVRTYCAEGVAESEACGDVEMQAEFLLQGALLNMMDGKPLDETIAILRDVEMLLGSVQQLSTPGELLQVLNQISLTDLCTSVSQTPAGMDPVEYAIHKFTSIQDILLTQLENLGELIERRYDGKREYATPDSGLKNLYLPHHQHLVQVKLRLGYSMACMVSNNVRPNRTSQEAAGMWSGPLGVLTTALEISKVIAHRVANVEAELLLNIGKIQRQAFHLGYYHQRDVASVLLDAIYTSYTNDHDLGLIRQCYLELAILYLASSGVVMTREGSVVEPVADSEDDASSITSGTSAVGKKKSKRRKSDDSNDGSASLPSSAGSVSVAESKTERNRVQLPPSEKEMERRAAWIAIKCATAAGTSQRARMLLVGDTKATGEGLNDKALENLPQFIAFDLMGTYVLGERKRVYKNEIEEELAPLTEALDPPPIETYEDELVKAMDAAKDLSWIHIMGYQAILQRACSMSTHTIAKGDDEMDAKSGNLGPEFDLGFISHAQFDINLNPGVVRTPATDGVMAMRLKYLHRFLTQQLPQYAMDCNAIYPPKMLQLKAPSNHQSVPLPIISKSYTANLTVPLDANPETTPTQQPPASAPSSTDTVFKPSDKEIMNSADNELSVQWYMPSLEQHWAIVKEGDEAGKLDRQIMMIFALSKKKQEEKHICSLMWVSYAQLIDLHDRLTVLTQRGEISLTDKTKKETVTTKTKKVARIKALSPKIRKDEHLEALLKQCCGDTMTLLGWSPDPPQEELEPTAEESQDQPPPTAKASRSKDKEVEEASPREITFDINKTNIHNFERLFDPAYGASLKEKKMWDYFVRFFPY